MVTLWGPVLALGRCTTLSFILTDLAGIKQQKKVGVSVQNCFINAENTTEKHAGPLLIIKLLCAFVKF